MASMEELMSNIPIASIAQKLGVDEATARQAVEMAVPTMVGGLQANTQDDQAKASLVDALQGHGDLVDGPGAVKLDQVDTNEGEKIVSNVFGNNTNQVINTLGDTGGAGGGVSKELIGRLMPMIAPIVLAYVARQMGNKAGAGQADSMGGGLGDVLGGLLGGSKGGNAMGGAMGNIIGGMLGNKGAGLGGILGGLLGGGRR